MLHESQFGFLRLAPSRRREVIERYIEYVVLTTFSVLDYDWKAADWHAQARAAVQGGQDTTRRRRSDCCECSYRRANSCYVEHRGLPVFLWTDDRKSNVRIR